MKAISIKEPWAGMIRDGEKTIETRTWSTKHRGTIILCASQKPRSDISGKAFAIAKLIEVRPMTDDDEILARCDVYPNAKSWVLSEIIPIDPFPVKGKLGLFEVDLMPAVEKKNHEMQSSAVLPSLQD